MPQIAGIEITSEAHAAAVGKMAGRFVPNEVVAELQAHGVLLWDADKIVDALISAEKQAGRIEPTAENDRAWQRL